MEGMSVSNYLLLIVKTYCYIVLEVYDKQLLELLIATTLCLKPLSLTSNSRVVSNPDPWGDSKKLGLHLEVMVTTNLALN